MITIIVDYIDTNGRGDPYPGTYDVAEKEGRGMTVSELIDYMLCGREIEFAFDSSRFFLAPPVFGRRV